MPLEPGGALAEGYILETIAWAGNFFQCFGICFCFTIQVNCKQ